MTPMHLLVLERDPARREALLGVLRSGGHHAVAAPDAPAAAAAIGLPGFDALLLDLGLPDLDVPRLREVLAPAAPPAPDSLEAAERRHIALVLRHTRGNKRQAAHLLGISRSTLLHKVRKYGLATGCCWRRRSRVRRREARDPSSKVPSTSEPAEGPRAQGTMRTRPRRDTTTVRLAAPRLRGNEALDRPIEMPTGEKAMTWLGPVERDAFRGWARSAPGSRRRRRADGMESSAALMVSSMMRLWRMALIRARRWADTISRAARSTARLSLKRRMRGSAMAVRIPMMTSTRTSSMRVAPRRMGARIGAPTLASGTPFLRPDCRNLRALACRLPVGDTSS